MAFNSFRMKASFKTPKVSVDSDDKKARLRANAAMQRGLLGASEEVESKLPSVLNRAMESPIWDWTGITRRKNGSTVGSPRDIVDTGRLRDSLNIKVKYLKTKTDFIITYTAPYATLIHEGGVVAGKGSDSIFPARPWIRAVLEPGFSGFEAYDYKRVFEQHIVRDWDLG